MTGRQLPLSDDQLLSGLWWSDPEYPSWVGDLWSAYVERMHEWDAYRKSVATILRTAPTRELCPDCDGAQRQRLGWGPGQQVEAPCTTCCGSGVKP